MTTTPTKEEVRARRIGTDVPSLLPEGRTCSDCAFFSYCEMLFQCSGANEYCDWSPSRFRQAPAGN